MSDFVTAKRAVGRRYLTEEKQLQVFDAFLTRECIADADAVTPVVIDAFLASRSRPRPRSHNELLGVVRRLFEWLVLQGRLSCSPVRAKPRRRTGQRIPCLLGVEDAQRLFALAESLPDNPRARLRGPTYKVIFTLLYGLGLRVGEASRLKIADIDTVRNLLVIRETKFGKSRFVPFGPRIGGLLRDYLELRGSPVSRDAAAFSFTRRGSVHPGTISQTFHQLVPRLELTIPQGVAPPRLHDLRHAFAVGRLLRWYRDGVDPASRLLHLATFMGHVNPSSTAVYLTITADLLAAGNRRFEAFAAPALAEVSQ